MSRLFQASRLLFSRNLPTESFIPGVSIIRDLRVCDQRACVSISNLPTAGVCDQRIGVGPYLGNLPTAGICDQRVNMSISNLPTAGVCDQHL